MLYLVCFTNKPATPEFVFAATATDAIEAARQIHPEGNRAYCRPAAYGEHECAGEWTNDGAHICNVKETN